jgi:hypothetical protein
MNAFAETEITRAIRQQALAIEIALLIRKATAILSEAFSRADSLGMAATSAEGTARKPVCVNADANVRRSNSGNKIGRDSRRDGALSGRRNAVQRAGFPAEFRVSLKHEDRSSAIGPRAL